MSVDGCVPKKPVASFLQLTATAIMVGMSPALKYKKLRKNLVKHFFQLLAE
jgi:hypothetical protein